MTKLWVGVVLSCAFALFFSLGVACGSSPTTGKGKKSLGTRILLSGTENGLSDLTITSNRELWTISESTHRVYRFSLPAGQTELQTQSYEVVDSLDNHLGSFDLEGIAFLHENNKQPEFAISAEQQAGTTSKIYFAVLQNKKLVVDQKQTIDLTTANAKLSFTKDNMGAEGICADNGILLVAFEATQVTNGERWARVVRIKDKKIDRHYMIRLTSNEGKLSALSCRIKDDSAEVLAIERHFGCWHVLSFKLKQEKNIIHPQVLDIRPLLDGHSPNLEGIVKTTDGRLLMIADNHQQGDSPRGGNYLWTFNAPPGGFSYQPFNPYSISNCTP